MAALLISLKLQPVHVSNATCTQIFTKCGTFHDNVGAQYSCILRHPREKMNVHVFMNLYLDQKDY